MTDLAARLAQLETQALDGAVALPAPYPSYVLILSVSDGDERARVVQGRGESAAEAWALARSRLIAVMEAKGLAGKHLRLDWVTRVDAFSIARLRTLLRDVKRNYSRKGIALDAKFARLFTEQELNANAMLYGGNSVAHCLINETNFQRYATQKYGANARVDFGDDQTFHLFETRGAYIGLDGVLHPLSLSGRDTGRRLVEMGVPLLDPIVASASGFLAGQVGPDGRFIYGWHPCFDREIPAYNALRHASTTYSMLEAFEQTRDPHLLAAAERALTYLKRDLIKHSPDGRAYVVDTGGEVKLGANATAILALSKHAALCAGGENLALMEALALGILAMQAEDGSFTHVLNWPDLDVKDAFRIVYYEGEAAFALMRLYDLTRDPRWIGAVERAFGHFIAKDYWRFHDHWLSYCADALSRHRPELRYLQFGVQNFAGLLDFVRDRITTFPTLLELMMAGHRMIERLKTMPEAAELLASVDQPRFYHALHTRAAYLMNGYFWPEMAMFFRNPQRIAGAFFIRHHGFRVRIDDVEHYLSGLISYRNMLAGQQIPTKAEEMAGIVAPPDPSGFLILSYPDAPESFDEANALAAQAEALGMVPYYASYRRLRLAEGKIDGSRYQAGRWQSARFVVPAIIDNAPPRNDQELARLQQISAGRRVLVDSLGGKQRTLTLLAAHAQARAWLIPYSPLNFETLISRLAVGQGRAIIKPWRANRGLGVQLIEAEGENAFMLRDNTTARRMNSQELQAFIRARPADQWMVQDYVRSVDAEGRAFDIRAHLQRDGQGRWQIACTYARLGAGGVTSNLATGGRFEEGLAFATKLWGAAEGARLIADIEAAAVTMADILQSEHTAPLDALGFDFGIFEGRPWLFEVNGYPGIKGFIDSASALRAGYIAFIARQMGAVLTRPEPERATTTPQIDLETRKAAVPQVWAATEANRKLLQSVMDRGANDFSASVYLRRGTGNPVYAMLDAEARKHGLTTRIRSNTHVELLRGDQVLSVFSPNSPDVACAPRELSTDKMLTKTVLRRQGIPVPEGRAFDHLADAQGWAAGRVTSQVVKPSRGSGGYGVSVGVDASGLPAAFLHAQSPGQQVIVEDMVEGDELRLIVLDGRIIAAVCRIPAFVVGDGRSSVAELVAAKNKARQTNPLMRVYPITQFDYLEGVLGLTQSHVPQDGDYVRLAGVSNVGMGGEAVSLIDVIHPSFHDYAKRAFAAFPGATQLGFDVMAKDFGADAFDDNAAIIEVNADPAIGTPAFAAWGPPATGIAAELVALIVSRRAKPALRTAQPLRLAPVMEGDLDRPEGAPRVQQAALLRRAAVQQSLPFEVLSPEATLFGAGHGAWLALGAMPQSTRLASRRITLDPVWCDQVLAAAGLPVPKRAVVAATDLAEALRFAKDLAAPVSLARLLSNGPALPLSPLRDAEALSAAFQSLAPRARRLVISQMLPGPVHRLLVVGGRIVSGLSVDGKGAAHALHAAPHEGWSEIALSVSCALYDPQLFEIVTRGAVLSEPPQSQRGWMVQRVELEPSLMRHMAPSTGSGRDVARVILNHHRTAAQDEKARVAVAG